MPTPRKSLERHELDGTKPHYEVTPKPDQLVAGRPRFPKGITPDAKSLYKRLCKQLAERRALTEADEYLLTLAVSIWDRRARAQAKLLEEGEIKLYTRLDNNGIAHEMEKPNLWLKVAAESEKQLVAILDRLGLTPLAGSKIKKTRAPQSSLEQMPEGSVGWMILQGEKAAVKPEPISAEELAAEAGDDE